jgi:hypothetical protein
MKCPGLILSVLLAACASAAAAEPVPYAAAPPPANWRDQAQLWLGGTGREATAPPLSLQLNNYWGMRQDQARPWKGTPRGDGYNGRTQAGEAVFADARWSARAIAIELRDDYVAGARTPRALGRKLASACVTGSGAGTCPTPADLAAAIAAGAGRAQDRDAGLFTPAGEVGPTLRPVMRALALREVGPGYAPSDTLIDAGVAAVAYDGLDQSRDGYERWRTGPGRAADVARFDAYLVGQGLGGVFPTWQLLRTASDWKGCGEPFAVPPPQDWANFASTLRLVQETVKPAVPGLEAKSAYRGPWLNVCTGGAEKSAHRDFWALDLTPQASMSRADLMTRLCPLYVSIGAERNLGLGFYGGVRFHIDTKSHRSWASYNGRPYGPCARDGSVNPPPDTPPPAPIWPPPPAPR